MDGEAQSMNDDLLTHDEAALAEALASMPLQAGVAFAAACARLLAAASQANGIDVTFVLSAVDRLRAFESGHKATAALGNYALKPRHRRIRDGTRKRSFAQIGNHLTVLIPFRNEVA
jgi:hypothetical protein